MSDVHEDPTDPDPGHIADPDDDTSVVVIAAASASPVAVWDVLVNRTEEWWGEPYLSPDAGPMRLDPRLGGKVWSGSSIPDGGHLHGTIRAFDPPERLEIGGVLVPGAYAGTITVTIEKTGFGSEIRVEQMARGRISASTEDRISHGWTQMSAHLAELSDA